MKKIILKQLRLVSFKGIKSLKVSFPENATIYGNNATGKTTIFDAFLWLLFGKDSSDRTDSEIKHISQNGQLLSQIEESIEDQSQAYQVVYAQRSKLQVKLHQSRTALQQIMMNAEDVLNRRKVRHGQQFANAKDALQSLQLQIHRIQEEAAQQITNRDTISLEMDQLRSKWHTENSKGLVFDSEEFICPTCKRNLDVDDVENKRIELEQTINRAKVKILQTITDTGTRLKQKLDASNQAIGKYQGSLQEKQLQQNTLQQQLTTMQAKVINSQVDTDNLTEYAELKETISSLEQELSKQVNMPDVDALKRDKVVVKLRIDDINKTLALKDMIGKSRQRIAMLEQEQQTLAQELADMEKTEFTIQAFERAKVESLERKVNWSWGH